MAKIKEIIDEEEYERMEQEARHDDLISTLKTLRNDNGELTKLAQQVDSMLSVLTKKNFSTDISPLLTELNATLKVTNEMLKAQAAQHATFIVQRNKLGLIEKVIMNEKTGH